MKQKRMSSWYQVQALLNSGQCTLEEAQGFLTEIQSSEEQPSDSPDGEVHPVRQAVEHLAGPGLERETDLYCSYMELFLDAMAGFFQTPALILPESVMVDTLEALKKNHAVSQRMGGDVSIVTGVLAEDAEFLKLASRCSQEDLKRIDALAKDSIEELINVVNGHFIIQLAKRGIDVELETPRSGKNIVPHGDQQLALRVCTDSIIFYMLLATDDFL